MTRDAHNDSGNGIIRGAIVIVLAGILIGLLFNALLRASNGDHGLAWFRQEVKLNSLEEVIPDSSAVAGVDSVTAEPPSIESAEEPTGGHPSPEVDSPAEVVNDPGTEGTVELPPPPASVPVPVIPSSDEPLLAHHGTVKVLHAEDAAVFVDARSPEEFAAGHIPGAVNLPFDLVYEDPSLLEQLDAGDRPIVSYCDGSECDLAENLAFVLIDAGYRRVLVYEGGTLAWTAAGESLTTGGGN